MSKVQPSRRAALRSLAAIACLPLAARIACAGGPGDSVYALHAALTDQDGRAFELSSLRGAPVLASMFYSSCDMVCPLIFETIHATLDALPPAERPAWRVLMVSFDPARDTVPVLKQAAADHHCGPEWTLARCDDATARAVAAVFGVQYRRLKNGEFNHSTVIDLLDREGRIATRTAKLGAPDPAFVAAMRRAYRSPA